MLKLIMNFLDLFSSSKFAKLVNNDINNNTLNHVYLISGADEVLNQHFALSFCSSILCNSKGCGQCATCKKINAGTHADVMTYPMDKNNIVVDDINHLVENIFIYPLEGDKKVFILHNFDLATVQAQNKLLKTLEEPPHSAIILITTTNSNMVLNTIKSRVKLVELPLLENCQVEKFLTANSLVGSDVISDIIVSAQGNLQKAIKISMDKDFLGIKKISAEVLINLLKSTQILKHSSAILKYKTRLQEVFEEINILTLDMIYAKTNLINYVCNKQYLNDFVNSEFSITALKLVSKSCAEAVTKLNCHCNATSVVDGFLINMLEVKHKWK